MKKRNKWKIWLSDAILKHRRTYAGIPGFFKKRIVNTLCLSFLLLYGGSALGLAQRSAGFVGWTVFLTICGIGDAVYVYYLAVTRSYEVVEGTVSEIHAELFFDGFKRVIVLQSDGPTTELLLNNEKKWAKMALLNTACSGKFSSDRTIQEYVDDIWHLDKVTVTKSEAAEK